MARFLTLANENEGIFLPSRDDLMTFVDFREKDTKVYRLVAKECCMGNTPLLRDSDGIEGQMSIFDTKAEMNDIRKKNKIPEWVSDDAVSDCMRSNGMLFRVPEGFSVCSVPVSQTGMASLGARVNLLGKGLSATEETRTFECYTPEEKAWIANTGLRHNKTKITLVCQDECLVAIRSEDYTPLPLKELVLSFEEKMGEFFSSVEYLGGRTCRQLTVLEYEMVDTIKTKNFARKLRNLGFDCDEARVFVQFATSDTGDSAVQMRLIYDLGRGRKICSDECARMVHFHNASVDKFKDHTCKEAIALLEKTEKCLESLASTSIDNPGGCLRNIAQKIKLPKEASLVVGANMDAMYPRGCLGLDVYCNLYEILSVWEQQVGKPFIPTQRLHLEEKVAKALLLDFAKCDVDFEWR